MYGVPAVGQTLSLSFSPSELMELSQPLRSRCHNNFSPTDDKAKAQGGGSARLGDYQDTDDGAVN